MQTPTINVSQTTCILTNCQANATPWRDELQMEPNTLPKGGLSCPTMFVEWLINQCVRRAFSPLGKKEMELWNASQDGKG